MPAISKIRFTNLVYERGGKRYNDDIFQFDGYNGAILLENGGGKTVFVQAALQAILPHYDLDERKIRDTLSLDSNPCHIAIEWILNERPRKYLLTAVTLFLTNNRLDSYKYVYEYSFDDEHSIDRIPFVKDSQEGGKRPASKGEINDYYQYMQAQNMNAKTFRTIKEYQQYIEDNYKIIPSEWRSIGRINSVEGGVEKYFDECKTTSQLVDRLLIPVVEEAISEEATKDFVKTFEEQRERFKKHRQLRERIEESRQIEEKIDAYVNVFNDYYKANEKYTDKKAYSKSVYKHLEEEKVNIEEEINKNSLDKEEIASLFKELNRKEKSYDIAILEEKLDKYRLELDQCRKSFLQSKNDLDSKNERLNNLKIAKLKEEIKIEEENIESYKRYIDLLQSDEDIQYVQEKLEENSSILRGYFISEEEKLYKNIERLEIEERGAREEYEREEDKLRELEVDRQGIGESISRKKGQNIEIGKSLKTIKDRIVVLNEHDHIKKEQQAWQVEVGQLESMIGENSNKISQLQVEKNTISNDLVTYRNKLGSLKEDRILIKNQIDMANTIHQDLLIQVQELNSGWNYIDSLYTRQQSIMAYMEGRVESLINEKEELLLEERISGRFQDAYADNELFTPEPMVEKWMKSWKNQFNYIETGVEFIQRSASTLNIKEIEFLNKYPYWAFAIIVGDQEVGMLEERLSKDLDKMTAPILILGEGEASKIVRQDKGIDEILVLPEHWTENINEDNFKNWKEQIKSKVHEVTKNRKYKEQEIDKYEELLRKLKQFFDQYSYENYTDLRERQASIEENCNKIENLIKDKESRLNTIEEEINVANKRIDDSKEKIYSLNQWIQLAHEYIIKEKEKEDIRFNINQLNDKYEKIDGQINTINQSLARRKDILEDLKYSISQFKSRVNSLIDRDLYKEVKDARPIFTHLSIGSLEEERINLKNALDEKQKDIGEYHRRIKDKEKYIESKVKDLHREKRQNSYPIDEDMAFPFYGEKEMEDLLDSINEIKPIKDELKQKLNRLEGKYNRQSERCNVNKEEFFKEYEAIVEFSGSLENIKIAIGKEKDQLLARENKNKETYERLAGEKEDIHKCIEDLKIADGKYEYLAESIKSIYLEEDFYRDFPYSRKTFINNILEDLESLNEKLKKVINNLEDEKNRFIIFCNNDIKDPRLRERTVSGVSYKTNYDEILQWQGRMKTSIETTIKIAEDDIRQHDKDLQQFINHLSTYLRTLTDELSIIPKKTRIKIDDKWRDVYQFNIPEWKEEEGKEELRKHIDWMIQQLESREFKNEDGSDNSASMRKEIEKWLDSKQLLTIVLKNNQIKVSCRKVTNDGKISGGLTSWESSNRWSGGEKWSKNMTLFLGILNYVAEKRQGIIPGLKSNRTVIVDNPFGKASSDHVLDPVFMIAEKLGFQIIALTAHTEGSFIRNYFPVVYSCRLRPTIDDSSLIVDKEKEIQYAFFKDRDPDTLNRLDEIKQMTLFA